MLGGEAPGRNTTWGAAQAGTQHWTNTHFLDQDRRSSVFSTPESEPLTRVTCKSQVRHFWQLLKCSAVECVCETTEWRRDLWTAGTPRPTQGTRSHFLGLVGFTVSREILIFTTKKTASFTAPGIIR